MEWKTERRKIRDLVPTEHNPRILTEKQYADLKKSLEKFNLAEIPAINQDGQILAGHQRLKILLALNRGDEIIDVRVPNRLLTKEECDEYLIRSNKNTGDWNMDELANCFDLDDLKSWGFDDKELGIFSAAEAGNPDLPEGDRQPFRQMTFTVHDTQFERIETAMAKAKAEGGADSPCNENANGNALAFICERFLGG